MPEESKLPVEKNLILQLLGYPIIELIYDAQDLCHTQRKPLRSAIKITCTLASMILGILLAIYTPQFFHFCHTLNKALVIFDIPGLQVIVPYYLAAIIISSPMTSITNVCIKAICKYKFGDPEYILTNKRAHQLASIFSKKYLNYSAEKITLIFRWCRNEVRKKDNPDKEKFLAILEGLLSGNTFIAEKIIAVNKLIDARDKSLRELYNSNKEGLDAIEVMHSSLCQSLSANQNQGRVTHIIKPNTTIEPPPSPRLPASTRSMKNPITQDIPISPRQHAKAFDVLYQAHALLHRQPSKTALDKVCIVPPTKRDTRGQIVLFNEDLEQVTLHLREEQHNLTTEMHRLPTKLALSS